MMIKVLYISIFVLFVSACTNQESENPPKSELPNIIYILADDLGYGDLSCYGQDMFSTPNIDRLAKQGMKFTQHYSGSTVCAPSRCALMTGLHTGHCFIRGNREQRPEGQYPIPDETLTFAEVLKTKGYVTGAFGKWGLGPVNSEGDPLNQGFDRFFGYNCQRIGHHYYPYHLWDDRDSLVLIANAGRAKGHYAPDLIHEQTLAFIDQHADEPFFLYVPSIIPHAELIADDTIMDKYRGKYEPETPYVGTDDGPKYRQGPYESQAQPHAAFVAMIEVLDRQVGEIIDRIEQHGLSENTLIIFTSDNGPHLEGGADPDYFDSNGPLKGYKRDLYEGGIRVPLIASWPGSIDPGTTSDHVSAFWDMMPTVADIIGVDPPDVDGLSFLPTLLGDSQEQHDFLYWEFHERGGRQAIRKGKWKAVRYGVLTKEEISTELYDLDADIEEANDLAEQYPDVVNEMNSLFDSSRTESDVFAWSSRRRK